MSLREKFKNEVNEMECCCDCFECQKQELLDVYLGSILDAESIEEIKFYLEKLFDETVELVEDELEDEDWEELDLEDTTFDGDIEGVCECCDSGDSIVVNGDVIISVYMNSEDAF